MAYTLSHSLVPDGYHYSLSPSDIRQHIIPCRCRWRTPATKKCII